MCVLIVDDCAQAGLPLKTLLQSHGYPDVLTAGSAQEAFDLLDLAGAGGGAVESRVHVVLMDVSMPEVDGVEACRRIKAAKHLRHLPILMVTGSTDEQTLQRAFDAGACDFIAKPFQPAELLARLRSALNLKQEIDRCRSRERELLQATEQLRLLNEELARLAILDELTGVANRRFFNMVLPQEWSRAMRAVAPLSLILLDIDHFKDFNDHYGHQKGDECLRQVAGRLKELMMRPGDHLARYGGEEFAIILPRTGGQGAMAVAERLRRAVEEMGTQHPCSTVHGSLTVSLGVATAVPERRGAPERLLAAADHALYEAKRLGRNQTQVFRGLLEESAWMQGPHGTATTIED